MRSSYIPSLAFAQALLACTAYASPLQLNARQDSGSVTPTTTSSASLSASSDPSAGAAPPSGVSITATLFQQNVQNAFAATPASAPSDPVISGCVLATQQATTVTEAWTFNLGSTTSYESDFLTLTDGLYCTCADGWMAGTIHSYNPEGTEFIFCATGSSIGGTDLPTNAVSTGSPQASAVAGDPNNPDWADVSCDTGSLPNVGGGQDPAKMWNDSGANAAWDSMYAAWQVDQSTTYYNFSSYLMNYFHGPTPNPCDVVGQGSCDAGISCGTHNAPNAVVNSPAGYMIIATMEGLHQLLEAVNTGITQAASTIDVAGFTKAFSPITSELAESAHTKLILDIVLIAVSVALVGVFEAAIAELPAIKAAQAAEGVTAVTDTNTWNTIKTQFYLNFGSTLGFVKDQLPDPTLADAEAKVEDYIDAVLSSLQAAVSKLAPAIFDDPDKLLPLIDGAAYWSGSQDNPPLKGIDAYDVTLQMQRVVWASAMPLVWSTGTEDRQAFIMTSEGIDYETADPPTDCDGWDPADTYNYDDDRTWFVRIPDDQNAKDFFQGTFFCVDDAPYWLLTGNTKNTDIMNLDAAYGLDQLDGKAWGGITAQDLVSSAVHVWQNNGRTNQQSLGDNIDSADKLQALVNATVATTPLAAIPVCSLEQAARTSGDDLTNKAGNPNWPCPAS